MYTHRGKIDNNFGLVPKAMSFLTGYGIYVTRSTDRFVGRMLDVHAQMRKVSGPPVIGPLNLFCLGMDRNIVALATLQIPSGLQSKI